MLTRNSGALRGNVRKRAGLVRAKLLAGTHKRAGGVRHEQYHRGKRGAHQENREGKNRFLDQRTRKNLHPTLQCLGETTSHRTIQAQFGAKVLQLQPAQAADHCAQAHRRAHQPHQASQVQQGSPSQLHQSLSVRALGNLIN